MSNNDTSQGDKPAGASGPPPNSSVAPRPKPTKAEQQARVQKIYELLAAGLRRSHIHQYVHEKQAAWGMATRTIDDYIARATRAYQDELVQDRRQLMGEVLAKFRHLYLKSMQINDYKTARDCLKELATLSGLYKIQIELGGKVENEHRLIVEVVEVPATQPDEEQQEEPPGDATAPG